MEKSRDTSLLASSSIINNNYRTPWTEEDVARFRDAVSTFGFVASKIHKHMGTHTLYDSPLVLFFLFFLFSRVLTD